MRNCPRGIANPRASYPPKYNPSADDQRPNLTVTKGIGDQPAWYFHNMQGPPENRIWIDSFLGVLARDFSMPQENTSALVNGALGEEDEGVRS